MPCGVITFHRQVINRDDIDWPSCSATIVDKLRVSVDGRIEQDAPNMLHVDFANKFVGGGVLGEGCVQEEILFVLCPELIISRLLAEELGDNETLVITGYERFSKYVGYASSFRWAGDYVDKAPRDKWGRLCNEIVAMDALVLWNTSVDDQLQECTLRRELNKAYCGFRGTAPSDQQCTVATGNWGCGAFGGDPRVKALIQLMAASVAQRPVFYFTFGDDELANDIYRVHRALLESGCTVGQLWGYMVNAACTLDYPLSSRDVFDFVCNKGVSASSLSLSPPSPSL
jgi:poly(ADP-ribose) glycohydrolase